TSAARSVPGGVDVVVAGDLPDQDVAGPDQPLATERVFYAGQPVAAVIATSEAAAHDGAAAVEVDLEETEVVADAETAMQDGSPTQGPFALRDELADKLDIPAHKIRVVPMPVGGGFGGKVSLLEGLLALLAIRANRPLRLVLTRRQVFAFAKGAPAARFEIEIGAKKDGILTALRAKFS